MLVAAMAQQGKGARRLQACFFRTDGAVRAIAVDTGQPVTRAEVIDRLLAERLGALSDPLDPASGSIWFGCRPAAPKSWCSSSAISTPMCMTMTNSPPLIDRIAARIGGRRVVVHLPQDSHIPERAMLAAPAQQHLAAAMLAVWPSRVEGEPAAAAVAAVRAAGTDQGHRRGAGWPAGPLCLAPRQPRRGPRRRSRTRRHGVVAIQSEMLTRDYFRVEDEAGLRFWLYRDGLYDREIEQQQGIAVQPNWFMHGLFA